MGRVTVADAARSDGVEEVWIVDRALDAAEQARAWADSPKVWIRQGELAVALDGADAVVNAASHKLNVEHHAGLPPGRRPLHRPRRALLVGARAVRARQRLHEAGLAAAISMGAAPGITNMLAAAAAEVSTPSRRSSVIDATIPGRDWSPDEPYVAAVRGGDSDRRVLRAGSGLPRRRDRLLPAGSGGKVYRFPEGEVECVYTIHSEPATLPAFVRGPRHPPRRMAARPSAMGLGAAALLRRGRPCVERPADGRRHLGRPARRARGGARTPDRGSARPRRRRANPGDRGRHASRPEGRGHRRNRRPAAGVNRRRPGLVRHRSASFDRRPDARTGRSAPRRRRRA